MNKIHAYITTKLGKIEISQSGFTEEGYPGFIFSIDRDGKRTDLALLEVDEREDVPLLKIHVWAPNHEDPVFDQYLTGEQIDKMYEEESKW